MKSIQNSLDWFCVKHPVLTRCTLYTIYAILIFFCAKVLGFHVAVAVIIFLLMAFYTLLMVSSAAFRLMREPIKQFGSGDPYPLLRVTYELLKHENGKAARLLVNVYRSAALCMVGEFEFAISVLKAANIESNTSATVPVKLLYYNGLADAYFMLGDYEKYAIWFEQYARIFSDMKEGARKNSLKNSHNISLAQYHISKGEYTKALELLCNATASVEISKVDVAYLSAMAHIGLGDKDLARQDLMFVISFDKDIYVVKHARELLEELDKDSEKKDQDVENPQ